jgi:hypothetical protein
VSETPLGRLLREVTDSEPPVTIHPDAVRGLARRRRRIGAGTATLAVAGVVLAVVLMPHPVPDQTSSQPATARAHWSALTWQLPAGWFVGEITPSGHSYPLGAMAEGPFVSTVPMMGKREVGVTTVPTDGVIAWLGEAPWMVPPFFAADLTPDDGSLVSGLCQQWPGAQGFHALRLLGTAGSGSRVVIEGCIFGPHLTKYVDQLRAITASITLDARYP